MAEYIDREKMLKYIEDTNTADEWIVGQYNADWIYSFIESQPTAEVVEVTKVVEMLCKIKTNIIKNVSTMIENDFSEIVKDALGERRDA